MLEERKQLDNSELQKKKCGSWVSLVRGLSLDEYIIGKESLCMEFHEQGHTCFCKGLIKVAQQVKDKGLVSLNKVYRLAFSDKTYTSKNARLLLRIPLIAVPVKQPKNRTELFLVEYRDSIDVEYLSKVVNSFGQSTCSIKNEERLPLDKEGLEILTSLVSSEKDKEFIRMATCQNQRLSSTKARKIYGMENYTSRKKELDSYIKNAEEIRKTFEEFTVLEEDF